MNWRDVSYFVRYRLAQMLMGAFLTVVCVAFVVAFLLGIADGLGAYRAQSAEMACAQKQMDSRRFVFTDSVVCLPYAIRQDTTTVQLPK